MEDIGRQGRPEPLSYCVLDTRFGSVGLAWSGRGLVALQLPDTNRRTTVDRLLDRRPAVEVMPPDWLQPTIGQLQRYFAGTAVDLAASPIDLTGVPEFHARLYREMLTLGWGETVTYGELAARVGSPGAARAVGQAMGQNRLPVVIPCHRVLASGNRMGGFSAPGGTSTKLRLLAMEGVRLGRHDPAQTELAL
jgi:methylated-DNA-[protein]-cysteine S-methyltransferase